MISGVENWSVYGQLEYEITDRLTFTVEGRYSEDEISAEAPATNTNESVTFTSFAPRFIVDYQAGDDLLLYALVSKGTKPGGL